MIFHTYGNNNTDVIVLIHGMLNPWQIWEDAVSFFSKKHCVVVPELDAHTEDESSRFISIENEADQLRDYLIRQFNGELFAICGLSMGGRIAATLAGMEGIKTKHLVLDGAPLKKMPSILISIMKKSYISIINKSQKRDPKVIESCKKDFLPERYHEHFFKIADNMNTESINNILESVFSDFDYNTYDKTTRILFMHGTKGNEAVSKKAAVKMKAVNPQTQIRCFDGYAHVQLACFEPEKWIDEVQRFLTQNQSNEETSE